MIDNLNMPHMHQVPGAAEGLRGSNSGMPGKPDPVKLREAAKQFEAMLLRQLYSEMQKSSVGEESSMPHDFYNDMFVEKMADMSSSQGGIGIARVLERAWGLTPEVEGASPSPVPRFSPTAREVSPEGMRPPVDRDAEAHLSTWRAPIRGHAVLSSDYGNRVHPVTGDVRFHHGMDLAAPEGTSIYPTAPGRVVFAGERGNYGKMVEIEHPGGWTTRYAHASELNVAAGDWVTPDQVIGAVGSTGRSTGPHLHFEVRQGGRSFDPSELMHQFGHASR